MKTIESTLELDQRTRAVLEQVRNLGASHLRPLGLQADRAGAPLPPDHPFFEMVWRSGLAGGALAAPEEEEGGDGAPNYRHVRGCVLAEEASYWDRGVAVSLPGPGLGGPPVQLMGTPAQREQFLSIFRDRTGPPLWAAFAMTEPGAGSDVARIETRCTKDGDHWVLNGTKMFSSNSKRARWVAVFATADRAQGRAGHRAFVVESGTPGFEVIRVEKKMGVRAYETCTFVLQDCRVPAGNLLGGEEYYGERRGFKGAMASFNATRPVIAANAVGIARAAADIARDFIHDEYPRTGTRRALALERMVDMRRAIERSRLLCLRAAWRLDRGEPNALESSLAKMHAPPVALRAVSMAFDILGEAGIRRDRLLEKLYRDVKVLDIVEGTQQVQRLIVARRLVGLPSQG
ncbi:MAG: acyl-CoA dehydrogenase [Chloroflexi bacterium]|nr:MAG: acyl-CoA dehydrogenase [Chloroflexota bacterium]